MKPSEEVQQRNDNFIALHRDEPGFDGIYSRLIEMMNPNMIGNWVEAEVKRGSDREAMMEAVCQVLALAIICACGAIGGPMSVARRIVMHNVGIMLMDMMSGETEAGVVVMDLKSGTEQEATIEGLHRSHPFPTKKAG